MMYAELLPFEMDSLLNKKKKNGTGSINQRKSLGNLQGSGLYFALKELISNSEALSIIIVPDNWTAVAVESALKFFLKDNSITKEESPIHLFPDWEILPYDKFSPHQDIISERLKTLYRLPNMKRGALIVPVQTMLQRVCPKSYVLQNTLFLNLNDKLSLPEMRKTLVEAGYRAVPQVLEHGEFAVRGSIFDVFPMGSMTPFRIDLFDDEIESIRQFDVGTQRSLEKISSIRVLPAREYPLTGDAISRFRTQFGETFEGIPTESSVYLDVSEGRAHAGLEFYLPLFFEKTATLFDYFPENCLMIELENIEHSAKEFNQQLKERYEQYRHDRLRPILSPQSLYLNPDELFSTLKNFPQVKLSRNPIQESASQGRFNLGFKELPHLTIETREADPYKALKCFLKEFREGQGSVLFIAESPGRLAVLKELLLKIEIVPIQYETFSEFIGSDFRVNGPKLGIIIGTLDEGMIFEDLALIPEAALLGKKPSAGRRKIKKGTELDLEVMSLAELNLGSPVVHLEYGIGRYLGLVPLKLSSIEAEFLCLEYADNAKLYVPISSLHLISRYSGGEGALVPLHRLGTDQWQKAKRQVMMDVIDIAAELLEIYAKRKARPGFAFKPPGEDYDLFSREFPFEETVDQLRAIQEVLTDLTSERAMDRVVCGDVGFGKTEVALRAAFLVASQGKQVAVLVPTTLLAEQHFQTFSDRFANFPIKIEVLSRFKSAKEQAAIIENLKQGKVDILIGTHKILRPEVQFQNLGLLVIDEEHRFGVRQKEAFKAFRSEVDILTLTATPIPRTLNMALTGLRDLSLIATPPARRLSIKTFVREKNAALIQEAVLRELNRGGQVFYLYNEVETIENAKNELEKLIPSARIGIAHGQMPERDLERIMFDFYHRRFNVLVCTTIIETGIDIPTANTIIIERADKFGLAQLHQLRGRVGRSHHQAYAFCLLPQHIKITSDAEKRLEAFEALDELGVGFSLATHDLEIRGAGELLGQAQSGNIQAVGFPLFMELIDQAVKNLKKGETLSVLKPFNRGIEIDLQIPALIPVSYLPDVSSRLVLYKRLSKAKTKAALSDLMAEMIDRFGALLPQIKNLFEITELKLLALPLGIKKIEVGSKGGKLEFNENPSVDSNKIIELIQKKSGVYRLEGPLKLKFNIESQTAEARIKVVRELLEALTPKERDSRES